MKYLISFTGSFLIVCLILSAMYSTPAKSYNEDSTGRFSDTAITYRLGEQNGMVAVFKGDSSEAFFVSERRISDLPMHDAQMLKKGIVVASEEELKALTEEYCS